MAGGSGARPGSRDLSSFRDHFSGAAPAYAAFRPHYPVELFEALAREASGRRLAWDCATGNGQAAEGLARHFELVIATDASAAQLAQAPRRRGVLYALARAESPCLRTAAVDLITVAQALHWFDVPAFFAEASRVLAPGGVLAAWSYGVARIGPAIDRALACFYRTTVGAYWPQERSLVESGYRTLSFPFEEFPLSSPPMEAEWSLDDLAGYLRTWSATLRYQAARGQDPVEDLMPSLRPLWGDAATRRRVRWPLSIRAGRAR